MKFSSNKTFFLIILFLHVITLTTAAHYIAGQVDDALDLESPDNKIITLWNPSQGISDNVTDIVGPSGNSGVTKQYSIDCEQLSTPCQENDTIYLKIFNGGDDYVTAIMEFNVTNSSPDYVDNMQLNSPPIISISSPANNSFSNNLNNTFNCSYQDSDSDTANISLFANFSGSWILESSTSSSPGNISFLETLTEGYYKYSCQANDSLVTTSSSIQFITIDTTLPTISLVSLNTSVFCGTTSLSVTCTTYDGSSIDNVKILAISPSSSTNHSASPVSGNNYSATISVAEAGSWTFTCYSEDAAGNIAAQNSSQITAYTQQPNLKITEENIIFNNTSPIENEEIKINTTINNTGCVSASNVLVKFYNGDPFGSGTEIGSPQVISVSEFSSEVATTTFSSPVGVSEIYTYADANTSISESNESDNIEKKTLNTPSWQVLYGTIESVKKVLGSSNESIIDDWGFLTDFEGNVFISDSESQVDWLSLIAIGTKTDNSSSSGDLAKIDTFIGTTNYTDSVASEFSSPSSETFLVNGKNITSVQTIQSTNNENFTTGILWDYSDDTDGEYGVADKEDIVFVSKVNRNSTGEYGIYDYEVTIPVKLREYDTQNSQYVYFYYELV